MMLEHNCFKRLGLMYIMILLQQCHHNIVVIDPERMCKEFTLENNNNHNSFVKCHTLWIKFHKHQLAHAIKVTHCLTNNNSLNDGSLFIRMTRL